MTYLVMPAVGGGWNVLQADGLRARAVVYLLDEPLATRIAVLLNRHGFDDVPLEQVPPISTEEKQP